MSFPAYPAYKDSGVDWLGEIPEGWSIKPLWALFRRHKLTGFPDEQLLSVYRDYGVIPKASRDDNFNKPSDDLGAYQLVQVGDLAINKMKAWQGSVGISSHRGVVSPAYHVYAPNHSEAPQYLHHLFRCNEYIAGYLANSKGIRVNQWDLEPQQHSRMSVLLPSFQEQTQIARFLDQETARIDALIEEQQRLIELLKEKRQAVISHAVTKGLDPTVPMKDSGVEWLGEVPAHWETTPLRYVATMIDGDRSSSYPSEDDLVDEGVPFVSSKNIVGYKFTDKNLNFITPEKFSSLGRGKLRDGDLVITVRGTIGHVAVFDSAVIGSNTGFINAQMMIIRPKAGLTEYLRLCSESSFWQKQLDVAAYGSTVKQLSNPIVGGLIIALPPRAEIPSLVSRVEALEAEFEELISEAQMGTSLLQERRSALISAAVTGKIDVRGWQPPASTQAPESAVAEAV